MLERHELFKNPGQNFLTDTNILLKMDTAEIDKQVNVIEWSRSSLSFWQKAEVMAFWDWWPLSSHLSGYPDFDNVTVVNQDILKCGSQPVHAEFKNQSFQLR